MKKAYLMRLLGVCLLLAVVSVSTPFLTPAYADGPAEGVQIRRVSQQDLNGDGAPDLTTIECTIATPYDRVLVFDGAKNMRWSSRWEEATDFADDTWVFDIGGGGGRESAALVIAFTTQGDDTLARIYDGSETGGIVRYRVEGARLGVVEPRYPSMSIRARGDWLNADGTLNYNLDWDYDGPAANRESAKRYAALFALDGGHDAEGQVRDRDSDGVPDFLWTTLLAPVPLTEGIARSSAQVNVGRHRPSALTNVVFWPLLNVPEDPLGQNYFDTPLFLEVDWRSGLILNFRFAGYPVEHGYHINTLSVLRREGVNRLRFENPMAYYDLAEDRDSRPELFIRMAYTPPGDPDYITGGPTRLPMEMVQYSWNQRDHKELRWDYKVDLAGSNPIGTTVTLGDVTVEQVPHEVLPRWVVSRPWGFATFVAYESGDGYLSSEGLYEWSTLEGVQRYEGLYAGSEIAGAKDYTGSSIEDILDSAQVQRDYLAGVSEKSPEGLYRSLLAGFRGEYGEINGPVQLYFSPVDARLHLVGATSGVYTVGNRQRVEYRNLDGDDHLDLWQLYTGSQLTAQLAQTRDFLIYSGDRRVVLLRAAVPSETFRAQPPTNRDEWARLEERLAPSRRELPPDGLWAMLGQFGGSSVEISDAAIRDYRPLGDGGFRFVLDLREGFAVSGEARPILAGLRPGQYVLTYSEGFQVERLTPPDLSATVADVALRQLQSGTLSVTLRNDGLQDVPQATLELWARPPEGQTVLVASQMVALLSHAPVTTRLEWAPPQAGTWTVTPQISQPDGQRVTFNPVQVGVLPATETSPAGLVRASTSLTAMPVAALGLLAFAVIAALTFYLYWKAAPAEHADEVA